MLPPPPPASTLQAPPWEGGGADTWPKEHRQSRAPKKITPEERLLDEAQARAPYTSIIHVFHMLYMGYLIIVNSQNIKKNRF